MVIPREARKITYSTEIRELKKRLHLNNFQRSVVIGGILGDGNLEANWSKTNYRLKFDHSEKQKDYIFWKYHVLQDWVLTPPRLYEPTRAYSFRTISHTELTDLAHMFYKNKVKVLPQNFEEYLDSVAVAVWFMDDGNIVKRDGKIVGINLNTQSYTKEENSRIISWLKTHGIDAMLDKNHEKYRIGIWQKTARETFLSWIKQDIVPSMKYKLG